MHEDAGTSGVEELVGTLRWNEFEGGFWSLEPDSGGRAYVLQGWTPAAPLTADARVRARLRVREEQIGFLMAGIHADVLDMRPS